MSRLCKWEWVYFLHCPRWLTFLYVLCSELVFSLTSCLQRLAVLLMLALVRIHVAVCAGMCSAYVHTHPPPPPLFILSSLMQEHVSWHVEHFHGALLLGDLSMSLCLFHQKFLGMYCEPTLFGDWSWLLWWEWIKDVWNSAAITECFVKRSLNCSSFATF